MSSRDSLRADSRSAPGPRSRTRVDSGIAGVVGASESRRRGAPRRGRRASSHAAPVASAAAPASFGPVPPRPVPAASAVPAAVAMPVPPAGPVDSRRLPLRIVPAVIVIVVVAGLLHPGVLGLVRLGRAARIIAGIRRRGRLGRSRLRLGLLRLGRRLRPGRGRRSGRGPPARSGGRVLRPGGRSLRGSGGWSARLRRRGRRGRSGLRRRRR